MLNKNSPASEAIALLIELAEKGEINPWDVQVIEVIDRFLAELGIDDVNNLNPQETDLSQSGQVMLWASMLVLYKAKTLQQIEQKEEKEELIDNEENLDNNEEPRKNALNQELEKQIKRRTTAPPPSKRKVTLTELITQLQEMEKELKKANLTHKIPLKKNQKYTRKQALKTITDLAHNENLTELAQQLNQFLLNSSNSYQTNTLKLEDLVLQWQQHQQTEKQDKVGVFWALLLLSSQSKVELNQTEFYQDLSVSLIE